MGKWKVNATIPGTSQKFNWEAGTEKTARQMFEALSRDKRAKVSIKKFL